MAGKSIPFEMDEALAGLNLLEAIQFGGRRIQLKDISFTEFAEVKEAKKPAHGNSKSIQSSLSFIAAKLGNKRGEHYENLNRFYFIQSVLRNVRL